MVNIIFEPLNFNINAIHGLVSKCGNHKRSKSILKIDPVFDFFIKYLKTLHSPRDC